VFQKFASAAILDAHIASSGLLMRTAHRAVFNYTPRLGYLYVRSRMISSRCNDNFDEFPAEEIEKGYRTFIGKPVFVNHHNEDHRRARGVIIDAVLHKDALPTGAPDYWVEGLQEIDALTYPKLAAAIIREDIDRTSMGVDVAFSVCSACNNKATTPLEYCNHIPALKGRKAMRRMADGSSKPELIRERCHGLSFFENSLLVEDPADPTAYFLGSVELGPGLEHLGQRTATRTYAHNPVTVTLPSSQPGRIVAARQSALSLIASGGDCPACGGIDTISMQGSAECFDCEHVYSMHREAKPRYEDPADHPFFQTNPAHADHVMKMWHASNDDEKASGKRWYADAHLVAKALGTLHNGEHPHGNTHLAAGMLANYSAQTGWEANQHNAARALHEGKGIGGPGSGVFASGRQKDAADRMMAGESHHDVLSPNAHKIRDFAHLIEHGGDAHPHDPHVVIDRHALSVATGRRMTDDDYGSFPKTQRHYYGHVVGAYHEAARKISEQTGEPIAAHMVQATTWLAQQRHNHEGEAEQAKADPANNANRLNRGREVSRQKQERQWGDFRQQHLPDLSANPGTGYGKSAARGRRGRP
jgi:hypothetical protein